MRDGTFGQVMKPRLAGGRRGGPGTGSGPRIRLIMPWLILAITIGLAAGQTTADPPWLDRLQGAPAGLASGETISALPGFPAAPRSFVFWGHQGQRILLRAIRMNGGGAPMLQLYSPAAGELEAAGEESASGVVTLEHTLDATGLYLLILEEAGRPSAREAQISMLTLPGPVNSPGDPDGGMILPGQTVAATIQSAGDLDAFQFYGAAGDRVQISIRQTEGNFQPAAGLYQPAGGPREALAGPDGDGEAFIEQELACSGLYTVVVEDLQTAKGGTYEITIDKLPSGENPGIYGLRPAPAAACVDPAGLFDWDPVPGAESYEIWAGGGVTDPLQRIASGLTSPGFPVELAASGPVCYWQVIARTAHGVISGPVSWFGTGAPGSFQLLPSADAGPAGGTGRLVCLSWTPAAGAAGYELYIGDGPNPPLVKIVHGTSAMVRLTAGGTATWMVRAFNDCETAGAASGPLTFEVPAGRYGGPQIFDDAASGGGSAPPREINPAAAADCVVPSITVQPVNKSINGAQTATLSVTATGTATLLYQWFQGGSGNALNPINGATNSTYTTPALYANTSYWVRVHNGCGFKNSVTATVTVTVTLSAPANLTAKRINNGRVRLEWKDNSGNETGFKIERKTGPTGTWGQITTTGANAVFYEDTTVAASTTYFYRVRATNAGGDSVYTGVASANTGDYDLYLPVLAHTGAWRCDVDLANPGTAASSVQLALLRWATDNTNPTVTNVSVPAGRSLRLNDILGSTFTVSNAALGIRFLGTPVLANCRFYNTGTGNGTYGMGITGATEKEVLRYDPLKAGFFHHLAYQATGAGGFRTNIGFCSASSFNVTVRIRLFDDNGLPAGTVFTQTLKPFEHIQFTKIHQSLGVTANITNGMATIEVLTEGGKVHVYAMLIDNISQDPVYWIVKAVAR